MKTYRKRFMASTLALLMTVSIPLTALAEGTARTESNGKKIIQKLKNDPATKGPSAEDIKNAKDALDGAINAAEEYQKTDDYKNSKESKENLINTIQAAKNAKATLEGTPSKQDVDNVTGVVNALNSYLQDLQGKIREEKAKNALEKAKKELEQAINNAETFKSDEKYTKGKAEDKTAFDGALSAAKTAKDATDATVASLNQAKTNLVNAQEKLKNAQPQQKEADKFIPQTKALEVEKGNTVDIKTGLLNAPNDATVTIKTDVDTSEVGEKTGVLTVKFNDASTKDVNITVSVKGKTPVPSPTLVISGQKVSSNGYVSGYVKADGHAVSDVSVSFYTKDGAFVAKGKTDSNGYFEFYVGTEYYNYYNDGYYNGHKVYYDSTYGYYYKNSNNDRVYLNDYYWYGKDYRCGKSGYLLAEKLLYTTSEKAYVKGNCDYNNYYWQGSYDNKYYDYRVYPTSVSRTTSYVKGYLPNEKGRKVSVYSNDYYYDGYYSDGYYDYNGSWHYYNDSNGYYNRYNRNSNYYLGSATVDSDGYFTIYFNRSVPTSESLYYYVDGYKDGRYATAPSVSQAEAGTMLIKGKAGSYASIRVEDAKGTKIGTTTANSNGEFSCYLDRKLSIGETIKVIASESSKYDSQTTYKVVDTSLSGQTYARVSYIKGYPDGTFKPSNNVTRAEAAQMFATLLNGGTSFGTSSVTKFADANNKWYSPAVNYIAGKGLLSGYSDGTFKPDADITRAEFAQMISGYLKAGYAGSANFKDVKGHWASDAIDKVFGNKAVEGYPDGTFKPNKTLTRAEAVTVLNAVFNRYTTSNSLKNVSSSNLKNYSDISSSHWAYYQILDASNAHVSQKVTSTSNEEVWK
ncbi:S-layer homology domain-containing protein [Peptoniphilus lacrimalis]|uniref:SLH domain-containing protein n=1 Tax=Peptoniphilus lacrimalis 315-B TaxID=596330 RepID=D1VVL9_9FIRM|nr:S-layer homology domain-containing protein [Peptoniphilus lacrimalis]EFA89370.1 hypothetical protein HMPREF0628_1303 [Peptoniphilus lacrimalis 315-B]